MLKTKWKRNTMETLQQAESNLDTIALVPSQQLRLGSLQFLYSSFYLSMSEYRQFKELAYHLKKIELMKARIGKNEVYYRNMLKQKNLSAVQADIITEDISLLERFLMPIRKVIMEGLKNEDAPKSDK